MNLLQQTILDALAQYGHRLAGFAPDEKVIVIVEGSDSNILFHSAEIGIDPMVRREIHVLQKGGKADASHQETIDEHREAIKELNKEVIKESEGEDPQKIQEKTQSREKQLEDLKKQIEELKEKVVKEERVVKIFPETVPVKPKLSKTLTDQLILDPFTPVELSKSTMILQVRFGDIQPDSKSGNELKDKAKITVY